jgi:C1A family cysteine protease
MISKNTFVPGWMPSPPDERDLKYALRMQPKKKLPALVNLEKKLPEVFDQGLLGSCTAQAGAAAMFAVAAPNEFDPVPSRLFLYYYIRKLQGNTDEDTGGYMRNVFKAANRFGVCSEIWWNHRIELFATEPWPASQQEAKEHIALKYEALPQDIEAAKDCLASGYPIIFGMLLLTNFFKIKKDGKMPLPEGRIEGGHALCAIGYSNRRKAFLVRNSWGLTWGAKGNFWLPYAIFESPDYVQDIWTCKLIS